jgi:hypothetical protein
MRQFEATGSNRIAVQALLSLRTAFADDERLDTE